jgi:hypothetical protein
MQFKTKLISGIGGGSIVILAVLILLSGDYSGILNQYPNATIILISTLDNNSHAQQIDLLARSYNENISYLRWNYKDDKIKLYYKTSLVDTIYWDIYKGSKKVSYFTAKPITYSVSQITEQRTGQAVDVFTMEKTGYSYAEVIGERITVIMEIDYYFDKNKTIKAGTLKRTIEIYPTLNKETAEWFPSTADTFTLKYTHQTKDNAVQYKLNQSNYQFKDLIINWEDSNALVSNAMHYKNGKLIVSYLGASGMQKIDPVIEEKTTLKIKIKNGALTLTSGKNELVLNFTESNWNCKEIKNTLAGCEYYKGDAVYHSGEYYLYINMTSERTYFTYLNSLEPLECMENSYLGRDYTICVDKSIKGDMRADLLFNIK